jgi:hypothetical protein
MLGCKMDTPARESPCADAPEGCLAPPAENCAAHKARQVCDMSKGKRVWHERVKDVSSEGEGNHQRQQVRTGRQA